MICDICRRRFADRAEQGIYSHYKPSTTGVQPKFEHHYHLCKHCCDILEASLKAILFKSLGKYLPKEEKENGRSPRRNTARR